jgi:hypothetical protein
MAQENIGKLHLTAAQKTAINDAIDVLLNTLTAVSPNFVPGDRSKYGSINELNKLLVNKANDFANNEPNLKSPDVDWLEFEADYADRAFADTKLNTLNSIVSLLEDFKVAHDYDNYQAALVDYQFAQYKQNSGDAKFAKKVAEYKQFFPRTTNAAKKAEETK